MPLVPSNINEIFSSIFSSGLAYNNRYEVLLGYPSAFPSQNPNDLRQMSIRCDAISVPGRSVSTTPYRLYGPARNMPYEPTYSGELNMSIIVSEDLRERFFFETWMDLVYSRANYKFNYYDQYITDMTVSVLNKSDAPTNQFVIREVYPKAIGDIQLGYDKDNEIIRQDVTLSFRTYDPVYIGIQPTTALPPIAAGPPSPEKTVSLYVRNGSFYKVASDGTVNGIYDPDVANALRNNAPLPPR